jgi:hypothetical protein
MVVTQIKGFVHLDSSTTSISLSLLAPWGWRVAEPHLGPWGGRTLPQKWLGGSQATLDTFGVAHSHPMA